MQQLSYFLLNYKNYVLLATFGVLSVTALANFVFNPYGKQNAKLKRFNKKMLKRPSSVVTEIHLLPKEYQRQWRAYVNSGCEKPSTVFEFVKHPAPYLLWFAHFVATATSVFYLIVAILLNYSSLFTTQIVFLLLSALLLIVKKVIDQINLAHARKVFGKFLHDLNTVTQLYKNANEPRQDNCVFNRTTLQCNATSQLQQSLDGNQPSQFTAPINKTLQQSSFFTTDQPQRPTQPIAPAEDSGFMRPVLPVETTQTELPQIQPSCKTLSQTPQSQAEQPFAQPLQSESPNETIVDKAVRILRQKGLDNPRTVEEQRKLNLALNNLLQACCKRN